MDDVEEEIIEKLKTFSGLMPKEMSEYTRIYHDAGLSGDDFFDFMEWFGRHYCVDLSSLDWRKLSPPERTSLNPFRSHSYLQLTVRDLREVALSGSWQSSGVEAKLKPAKTYVDARWRKIFDATSLLSSSVRISAVVVWNNVSVQIVALLLATYYLKVADRTDPSVALADFPSELLKWASWILYVALVLLILAVAFGFGWSL